jgi:hypothetical protein
MACSCNRNTLQHGYTLDILISLSMSLALPLSRGRADGEGSEVAT